MPMRPQFGSAATSLRCPCALSSGPAATSLRCPCAFSSGLSGNIPPMPVRPQFRASGYTGVLCSRTLSFQDQESGNRLSRAMRSLPSRPEAGGRRGKERAASLRAQQRLAAGGRRLPRPVSSYCPPVATQGSPDPYRVAARPVATSALPDPYRVTAPPVAGTGLPRPVSSYCPSVT